MATDRPLDSSGLLSPAEAARRLGVSVDRVRQLARVGSLPSIMTPLGRVIRETDVAALAEERDRRRAGVA